MPKKISGKDSHPGKQGRERTVATEEDLETIYTMAAEGKSIKLIALRLGISNTLMDRWLGNQSYKDGGVDYKDERVRAAWEGGITLYEESLSSVLHKNAFNDNSRMQVAATMFLLKCKLKWRESDSAQVVIETKKKSPSKFKVKNITPETDE